MEQKKKKQEDVLVVRDEKTGEISVVARLDGKGYPKTKPAKPEHSQDFLRFDRHGDVIDNFFKNFYRQCKEPTRFGFYRVAADALDTLLPVRLAQGGHRQVPATSRYRECETRKQ